MTAVVILYRAIAVVVDLFLACLALYVVGYVLKWALTAALSLIAGKLAPPLPRRPVAIPPADGEPLTGDEERALAGIAEASAGTEREAS